jgi:hypothetical protein
MTQLTIHVLSRGTVPTVLWSSLALRRNPSHCDRISVAWIKHHPSLCHYLLRSPFDLTFSSLPMFWVISTVHYQFNHRACYFPLDSTFSHSHRPAAKSRWVGAAGDCVLLLSSARSQEQTKYPQYSCKSQSSASTGVYIPSAPVQLLCFCYAHSNALGDILLGFCSASPDVLNISMYCLGSISRLSVFGNRSHYGCFPPTFPLTPMSSSFHLFQPSVASQFCATIRCPIFDNLPRCTRKHPRFRSSLFSQPVSLRQVNSRFCLSSTLQALVI